MAQIIESFKSVVGFRQDYDFPDLLDAEIDIVSDSGLFYQDAHPMITLANIRTSAPLISDYEMTDSQFLRWLRIKEEASIQKVLNSVQRERNLSGVNKTILDKSWLYDGTGNVKSKEIKENRFVGFLLIVKNADQINAVIKQISLQFSETQTLPIYFYHSSVQAPVYKKDFVLTKSNLPNWFEDFELDLICDKSYIMGGYWLVGYYEEDVIGQALNKDNFNFIKGGCNCNGVDTWTQWSPHLSIQPIYVVQSDLPPTKTLPYEQSFHYEPQNRSYGMNMVVSTQCSVSQLMIRQKINFAKAISTQFAVDMLQEIAYTTRVNAVSEKLQQKANFELEDKENSIGLKTVLQKEICSVNLDLQKLGTLCFPSASKINYSSISTR